ncbi:MAG TPA: hypothetical protein VKZ66_04415 [Pusillimonas sp.]|uniref:hypothetical protein n=1 Tax=unclassified Pusillimonas TaxID=2640016 RepID=UPI0026070A48|nr:MULTISPECIES: hypothetical protein [unclassified Pusillimonas]HLU19182.1 hypothetical protein [Pusillimonas sp.]
MNTRIRAGLAILGLVFSLSASAGGGLAIGQKLSKSEIAELGGMPEYKIGKLRVRVLPSPYTDADITYLLNSRGVVGTSRNQVLIADATADTQNTVEQIQPRPKSVQYHEQTRILVATYSDFAQAIDALEAIRTAQPDAKVALPMLFKQQRPK